jgi:hypothetical protein
MIKFRSLKNRVGAAEDQKLQRSTANVKSDVRGMQEQERKCMYVMDRLSESFLQCASQLDNQVLRVNLDK